MSLTGCFEREASCIENDAYLTEKEKAEQLRELEKDYEELLNNGVYENYG